MESASDAVNGCVVLVWRIHTAAYAKGLTPEVGCRCGLSNRTCHRLQMRKWRVEGGKNNLDALQGECPRL